MYSVDDISALTRNKDAGGPAPIWIGLSDLQWSSPPGQQARINLIRYSEGKDPFEDYPKTDDQTLVDYWLSIIYHPRSHPTEQVKRQIVQDAFELASQLNSSYTLSMLERHLASFISALPEREEILNRIRAEEKASPSPMRSSWHDLLLECEETF